MRSVGSLSLCRCVMTVEVPMDAFRAENHHLDRSVIVLRMIKDCHDTRKVIQMRN